IIFHAVEEVLCPTAFRRRADLDLHKLEAESGFIEIMDRLHVACGKRQMMIAHLYSFPCSSTMLMTSLELFSGAAISTTRSSTSSYSSRSARDMVACIS